MRLLKSSKISESEVDCCRDEGRMNAVARLALVCNIDASTELPKLMHEHGNDENRVIQLLQETAAKDSETSIQCGFFARECRELAQQRKSMQLSLASYPSLALVLEVGCGRARRHRSSPKRVRLEAIDVIAKILGAPQQ